MCSLHFGLPAARRCGSIRIKSSTVQSSRKRAGKITLSLENAQSFWLSLPFFWMRFCTCLLRHTRRKPPFPCLGHAGQDRKSAGDVMGHKRAGLFDIVYWCVFCVCARRCNTPLKYQPILWELTTCHATTTKTPTSKRPPIHHQKYHSNATATPEKYLANIVKHSIKNISSTAKTFCFSLCLLYFFTNALHGPKTQRHRNKIKAST